MFEKIISILIAPILAIGALFTPVNPIVRPSDDYNIIKLEQRVGEVEQKLGASFEDAPRIVAFFEDSLATPLTASGTTFTLVSGKDKRGTLLASSTYGFVIDEGTAAEEIVLADCTGTSCANLARGLDPVLGTTSTYALIKAHGRGSSVKITDAPKLLQISSYLNGEAGIPRAIRLKTGVTLCGDDTCLATRKYVNDTAVAGAPDAGYSTKGIGSRASAAQASSTALTWPTSAPAFIGTDITRGLWRGTTTVVVTEETGYISPTFIATTSGYAWSASTTFSGSPITLTGSSTDIQTRDLRIGGVTQFWPDTLGASSTVLTVGNPNGALRWQDPPRGLQLLGDSGASSGATVTVSSLSNRPFLRVVISITGQSASTSVRLLANCCGKNEYRYTATSTGQDGNRGKDDYYFRLGPATKGAQQYVVDISNPSGNATKYFSWTGMQTQGEQSFPYNWMGSAEWASTTDVTAISLTSDGSTTFSAGTRIQVYGQ